jgi:hypothetical protein
LTLPLATLLGLAERPGAGHGLGPLDPALVRDLAATTAGSPHSQWRTTITDSQGTAVAHGCAKPARTKKNRPASRDGPARWAFTPAGDPGPPGGYGTWTLTLPGGRTCACNGGARSRRCHRVKQSPGWTVTQPSPAGTSGPPPPGAPTPKDPCNTPRDTRSRAVTVTLSGGYAALRHGWDPPG